MYEYSANVLRVVDGDTIDVMLDLGFDTWVRKRVRLYGIDCPETRTRDKKEKKLGLKAKEFTSQMCNEFNLQCTIKSKGLGKFGRVIGEVFFYKSSEEFYCLNDMLLDKGYATPFMENI
jgi:micrococcal nuclease